MSASHDELAAHELSSQKAAADEEQRISAMTEDSEAQEPSILDSPSSDPCLEQDGASDETIATTLKAQSILDSPTVESPASATFVRGKKGWTPKDQFRLKNSLLAGVGLLELANAGDFAANVWNEIPVPHFAMALSILSLTVSASPAVSRLELILSSSGPRRHPCPLDIHLRIQRCIPQPRKYTKPSKRTTISVDAKDGPGRGGLSRCR